MKCLVSARNLDEVHTIMQGGADIIDLKNPEEGSLGAADPILIMKTYELTKNLAEIEVSAAIGDVPYLPGTISLAAIGAMMLNAEYVKIGLYGTKNREEAIDLMTKIVKSKEDIGLNSKLVCAGYADAHRIGSVNPMEIPDIAHKTKTDIAMLDTAIKDGKRLFDFLSLEKLKKFTDRAHSYGLQVALAGKLVLEDIPDLHQIGTDIIGVRSVVCEHGDRRKGKVSKALVENLVNLVQSLNNS